MGKVSLNINGRAYGLGCEDGEEERLTRLGQKLDARVADMANQFGQIGDLRLLVMAGITLLDEMEDPKGRTGEAERRIESLRKEVATAQSDSEKAGAEAADNLISAAERIEKIAARLADAAST